MTAAIRRTTHEMARDVHEVKVVRTAQMHRRPLEQPIVLLANEERIVDSLLTHILHFRIRTDNANVIGVRIELIECDVLANEYANSYPAHVEPVEEGLNGLMHIFRLLRLLLQLENALRHSRYDWVVPLLDLDQRLRELLVVLVHLRRPLDFQRRIRIVPVRQPYPRFPSVPVQAPLVRLLHMFR